MSLIIDPSLGKQELNPSAYSLQQLISSLCQVFEDDHVNIEDVEKLLSLYQSNPVEWRKFANFDQYR